MGPKGLSWRRTGLPAAVAVVCLLLGLAWAVSACNSPDASTDAGTGVSVTGGPATIPDGVHFGFVRDLVDDAILFDQAEWLSGEAAVNAARADGVIGPTEDLPNPFYIRNSDAGAARLGVDSATRFVLLAFDGTGTPTVEKTLSFDEISHLWATGEDADLFYADLGLEGWLPVEVTVSQGLVTEVRQQYLP